MRNKIFLFFFFLLLPLNFARASDLEVKSGETITLSGTQYYDNVYIRSGGVLTTPIGSKLELVVSGELIIESGGKIDVSGKGNNPLGKGGDAYGPTCASSLATSGVHGGGGGGGGYGADGGKGGDDVSCYGGAGGSSYGDPNDPQDLGSPGGNGNLADQGGGFGGLGGGAVIIKAKKVVIEGEILANGDDGCDGGNSASGCYIEVDGKKYCKQDSSCHNWETGSCSWKTGVSNADGSGGGGGGSGGTINIQAEEIILKDGAVIQANGGNGGNDINGSGWDGSGGGGAGGRIYMNYGTLYQEGTVTIEAKGGQPGCTKAGLVGGVGGGTSGTIINPCVLGTLKCPSRCKDNLTREYSIGCNPTTGACIYQEEKCDYWCVNGECVPGLSGGLVPCGRHTDDPTTFIDETQKCTFCHLLILGKRIADFLFKILISFVILFLIIAGGLMVINKIETGKMFFKVSIVGAMIATLSWLVVDLFFAYLTPNTPFTSWNHALCDVAPCKVNGHCETDKGETAQNCPSDCACNLAKSCRTYTKKCDFDGKCETDEEIDGPGSQPESCPDCAKCGDNVIDVGEECDGTSFPQDKFGNPVSCQSYGYATGTLSCTSDCKIDLSGCHD